MVAVAQGAHAFGQIILDKDYFEHIFISGIWAASMNFAVSWSEVWSREIFGDARMTLNCSASDRIVREFSECPKLVARPQIFLDSRLRSS